MGVYNFNTDLPNAEKIEDKFESLLHQAGYTTERGHGKDWDIRAKHPSTGRIITFEIKFDEMSDDTGNIAIEYESRGKPSGISTTKSVVWVQYFENTFYAVFVDVLKKQLPNISFRDVIGGDPGSNTKMYLIKKDKFKSICITTF